MPSRQKFLRSLLAVLVASTSMSLVGSVVNAKANATKTVSSEDPIVEVDTNKGPIKIRVFKKQAPITSNNFLDLVGRGFYNGLSFHRYEPGFVIQGGDPTGTGGGDFIDPKTHQKRTIKLEKVKGLTHDSAGTVAMARTDNPNSASCQWYITLAPASFLDNPPGYAVFGKVVDGMDNVLKLRAGDTMTKVFVAK